MSIINVEMQHFPRGVVIIRVTSRATNWLALISVIKFAFYQHSVIITCSCRLQILSINLHNNIYVIFSMPSPITHNSNAIQNNIIKNRSLQWSTRSALQSCWHWFYNLVMDGRTTCVKVVIITRLWTGLVDQYYYDSNTLLLLINDSLATQSEQKLSAYVQWRQEKQDRVVNDPLGQPTVLACQWFFTLVWSFCDGRTDGRTTSVKIVITTGGDCGRPRGSIYSYFLSLKIIF